MSIWLFLSAFVLAVIFVSWLSIYGIKKSLLVLCVRLIWLVPFISLFFPQQIRDETAISVNIQNFYILLDDSHSMQTSYKKQKISDTLKHLEEYCNKNACKLNVDKLSDLSSTKGTNYSKLVGVVDTWVRSKKGQHWLVLSDGGDYQPYACCGSIKRADSQGLILSFVDNTKKNIWFDYVKPPITSFEDKAFKVQGVISRNYLRQETIQVVFEVGGVAVKTLNLDFLDKDSSLSFAVDIPGVKRGSHELKAYILPFVGETQLWDNTEHVAIETQSNTVGVLHLLGSPSWDGRFLRQYLKSEPKYDLVSFYILRDVWDAQGVDDRDLSLIPFPSERLFMTELPNFKILIIQNFMLYQFLQPKYQQKLVEFVENGGSLLFVGGERALQRGDLENQNLKKLLPFNEKNRSSLPVSNVLKLFNFDQGRAKKPFGHYKKQSFTVFPNQEFIAQNSNLSRIVSLGDKLYSEQTSFTGLNILKDHAVKPEAEVIYWAKSQKNKELHPLLISSKIGKGKSLWFMSDSFSQVIQKSSSANHDYHHFLNSAFAWFLEDAYKKVAAETQKTSQESLTLSDDENQDSWRTLSRLAIALGSIVADTSSDALKNWLDSSSKQQSDQMHDDVYITERKDYYWFWKTPWVYLSFLCLLLEPMIRRWR